ncbi:hypothetical protein B0181_04685 [Moraxella caviae]|uniref:Chaperone protein DnaJ n=1 Tax=Moraxella caviae TaxID=34060 RepID=A0A1T0A406_9GAMM|nr:DnaJ domain-containing protein [Moraxella caviae]OOR90434.1 hypothetical protein B0181_04685 [Moraxella caviae]STZ10497.1 Chaperone protein DnaJ [Moraxella caviae]VEW13091.1 Chaperone protein DnaJ [Moraxella caviae]
MTQTYYQLLGVRKNATLAEIKKAHRAIMAAHHPDRRTHDGVCSDGERASDEYIAQINAAYEMLKNPVKRAEYDKTLGFKGVLQGEFGARFEADFEQFGRTVGKQVKQNLAQFRETVQRKVFDKFSFERAQTQTQNQAQAHAKSDDENVHITLMVDVWQVALREKLTITTPYRTLTIALPALVDEPFVVLGAGKPLNDGSWSDLYITLSIKPLVVDGLNDAQKHAFAVLKNAFNEQNNQN